MADQFGHTAVQLVAAACQSVDERMSRGGSAAGGGGLPIHQMCEKNMNMGGAAWQSLGQHRGRHPEPWGRGRRRYTPA